MAFPYCQLNRMSRCAQGIMGYCEIKNTGTDFHNFVKEQEQAFVDREEGALRRAQ